MATHFPFHERLRYERERRGWSRADLASRAQCDTKTVGRWESGACLPRPYHRQILYEILGITLEELGLVQEMSPAPLQHTDQGDRPLFAERETDQQGHAEFPREDWGEAPSVARLYGRDEECASLERWIMEGGRVAVIVGMGGVGKTTVAARTALKMQENYDFLFWRSLQNAPPFEHILKQYLNFLSDQKYIDPPKEVEDQISLLVTYLRKRRCLLVLDNFETLLQAGRSAGRYRQEYAAYGRLLQRVGEAQHRSCLLVTSREKPKEVAYLEGKHSPVRSFPLSGLGLATGQQLLKDRELVGSDTHWLTLIERYSGNPLALQVVAETIQEVFAGDIARFLQKETVAFGDINDLLAQQFQRLSDQEQEMMYWLAIERELVSLEDLNENLVYPMPTGVQLEVLDSLRHRSLIERRDSMKFALQPVIMEYVTASLVERAGSEFATNMPEVWIRYVFCKAQAKEYVRESQERLLLAPLARRLLTQLGTRGTEQRGRELLAEQHRVNAQHPGYLAGNILTFLHYIHSDLRGLDCSHLVVRQAYLQGMMLPQVNFTSAHFVDCIFTGTFGNVHAVICSPQGQLLAAGTTFGEIRIYDTRTYTLLLLCHGHTDAVWSLAFSPNAPVLASGSDDYTVRLWDSSSGDCLKTLRGHTNRVRAIAFSPDGSLLASGSDDQTIRLWSVRTGECLAVLTGHSDRVWSVAFSPAGTLLASGSTDRTVRVWDSATKICLRTLRGHSGWVRSVAFHPQGEMLASGSDDQTVRLWNSATGACLQTLAGHTNRIWSIAFNLNGNLFASSSEDRSIRLWDVSTGQSTLLLQGHTQGVRSVTFTPGGHTLVSGGDDQTMRVWDTITGSCLRAIQGFINRVWSLAFHPDGSMLASSGEDTTIRLWDVSTGQCLRAWQDPRHGVIEIAISPDGKLLASGGEDQMIRLWDLKTGHGFTVLRGHANWIRGVAFSPDGKMLASGSEDTTIRLWDVATASCRFVLEGHTSWIRSTAFSPDSSTLASGSDDQTVRIWNATTGTCLRTLQGHTGRIRSVAFSPASNILASGSEDCTIHLWNAATGQTLSVLQGHTSWVRSVAFSPDGKILASSGDDQTIYLWDTATGQSIKLFQGHTNRARCVVFNPDGTMLASGSDDGAIKLWDLQSSTCLKTFTAERPYERMNISHSQGLTEAQKVNLQTLGAIEENQEMR